MISIKLAPFTLQIPHVDQLNVNAIGSPSMQEVPIDSEGNTVQVIMQPIYYELVRHSPELGEKMIENGNKSIPFSIWTLIQDFLSGQPISDTVRATLNGFFQQAGWPEIVIAPSQQPSE